MWWAITRLCDIKGYSKYFVKNILQIANSSICNPTIFSLWIIDHVVISSWNGSIIKISERMKMFIIFFIEWIESIVSERSWKFLSNPETFLTFKSHHIRNDIFKTSYFILSVRANRSDIFMLRRPKLHQEGGVLNDKCVL